MMHSTYCSKSWTDINIDFESRTLRHCCKAEGHEFPETLTEEFISMNTNIKERRQKSLDNLAHSDCITCWKDYSKGNSAYRDWANTWVDPVIELQENNFPNDTDRHIYYIEIKTDSTCDLACIYCSYSSSSKIAQEEGRVLENKTKEEDY